MGAYVLVVLVALLNILSVSLFKTGVSRAGGITVADLLHPLSAAHKILTSPFLLLGIGSSICTNLLWLAALTRLPANVALPLMNSVFYVALLFVSALFLGEVLNVQKVAAILLILAGAILLTR